MSYKQLDSCKNDWGTLDCIIQFTLKSSQPRHLLGLKEASIFYPWSLVPFDNSSCLKSRDKSLPLQVQIFETSYLYQLTHTARTQEPNLGQFGMDRQKWPKLGHKSKTSFFGSWSNVCFQRKLRSDFQPDWRYICFIINVRQ